MKILALSDLHGFLPDIPKCDVLLLGGDYCQMRNHDQQLRFMLGPFREWLSGIDAKYIVGIAGNHDFILQSDDIKLLGHLPWIYLQDGLVELDGIKIYGTPWTKTFCNWAFMKDEGPLKQIFSSIPEGLDILLTHGPVKGILDRNRDGEECGSYSLYKQVMEVQPLTVVHGHIHEGRGHAQRDSTNFYNVSHVNEYYEPIYAPVEINLDR